MHSVIGNSAYARLSGCPDIQSRKAASIRDCQPAPVDLKYSTTSDDKRMAVGILVVSAFGLPGLRTTFADAKKFCTCVESLGSYRSVSGSYVIGASVVASRCTRSQSVFEFFFKPGMVSLPFIFVGSTETDDSSFFARHPDNRKHCQYLGDICKRLPPDFSITYTFKLQPVAVRQDKTGINKVKMMLFKVYMPFCFVPDHNYCIYDKWKYVKE